MNKALLCHAHLDRYSGSEMVALELAEALCARGWQVSVTTPRLRRPIRPDFLGLGVEICSPKRLDPVAYDLIVVFHRSLDGPLRQWGVDGHRKIFLSLSPSSPEARPPDDRSGYDLFLANSLETRAMLIRCGVRNPVLFPNWAPESMYESFRQRPPGLERVLCVSNHLPAEVRELGGFLRRKGAKMDCVGRRRGSRVRRVDAPLLSGYDALITIGKTVQYGFAMGLPVYCYDKWGGHGYLLPPDIDHAEARNFSGRCCAKRKTAPELAAELFRGYRSAFAAREQLQALARERYRLETRIEVLLRGERD